VSFNDGYQAAEADIEAWLASQIPVPICEDLAARLRLGEHRGRAGERRRWEIPVRLMPLQSMESIAAVKAAVLELGADVMVDEGGYSVFPRRPMVPVEIERLRAALRLVPHMLDVEAPVELEGQRSWLQQISSEPGR